MKPTYLYVKTHNDTGLKYFGKTTMKDPVKYAGSGVRWRRHLKVNGYNVSTEVIGLFLDENWLKLYALEFSSLNNIVESDDWANLINEDGFTGGAIQPKGYKHSDETKEKLRQAARNRDRSVYENHSKLMSGRKFSEERKQQISLERMGEKNGMFGKKQSDETKHKISVSKLGRKMPPRSEEHRRKISENNRNRALLRKKMKEN